MNDVALGWYCVHTKPKHEHIAAAGVQKNLTLEVFYPRLRVERVTQRGIVRLTEPLFPSYIFVRCLLTEGLNKVQYSVGINALVSFNGQVPVVADDIIEDLRRYFQSEEPVPTQDEIVPGTEVLVAEGAFTGMSAQVLRVLSARQRVQVLLDLLGRPTVVELNRTSVATERTNLRNLVPYLAKAPTEPARL